MPLKPQILNVSSFLASNFFYAPRISSTLAQITITLCLCNRNTITANYQDLIKICLEKIEMSNQFETNTT
jgi:hypothetical protein